MADLDFVASTYQNRVVIEREDGKFKLEMSPSEVKAATHVVGLALSMIDLDNVPSNIKNTPFVVRFFENGAFALERTDTSGSMPFRVREGDDLIKSINMGLGICLNEQTQGRAIPSMTPPPAHMVGDEPL
jgi:hypothetical protein